MGFQLADEFVRSSLVRIRCQNGGAARVDDGEKHFGEHSGYIDQVTANSNVFLIYALAQTVTQTKTGKIRPTAECLTETLFERIPRPGQDSATFRTRTLRTLHP